MAEILITQGPPGTGKTKHIEQIVLALINQGVPAESIVVCSLTKAAAYEAKGRVELPDKNVGTMHSFAMRAVGGKEPVDVALHKFNKWMKFNGHDLYLRYRSLDDETFLDEDSNEGVMQRYMRARSMLQFDEVEVLRRDNRIIQLYEEYKKALNLQDFEDWIYAAASSPCFNGLSSTITHCLVDEAQDFSPSVKRLLDAWSPFLKGLYIVGDPMQALYRFSGADPLQFFSGADVTTLERSYRLPYLPWKFATEFAKHCPEYIDQPFLHRKDKTGIPEGDVAFLAHTGELIDVADSALSDGKKAMFLASTGKEVDPFVELFLSLGIPFRNDYRPSSRRWNPFLSQEAKLFKAILKGSSKKAPKKVYSPSLLERILSIIDIPLYVKPGAIKGMRETCSRGRHAWEYLCNGQLIDQDVIDAILLMRNEAPDVWVPKFTKMCSVVCDEYRTTTYAQRKRADDYRELFNYFKKVYQSWGEEAFDEISLLGVTVGTCHSVKGGTADVVVLSNGLSAAHEIAMNRDYNEAYSDVIRTFYVGATRTRDKLYFYESMSRYTLLTIGEVYNEIKSERKIVTG